MFNTEFRSSAAAAAFSLVSILMMALVTVQPIAA